MTKKSLPSLATAGFSLDAQEFLRRLRHATLTGFEGRKQR
jgi:hypothetical protein